MPESDAVDLAEALAHRVSAVAGVARLEPTLREVVAATAQATVHRFGSRGTDTPPSPSAGVLVNDTADGTEVTVSVSITTPPSARDTAHAIRAAITEELAAYDRRSGPIAVTIVGVVG